MYLKKLIQNQLKHRKKKKLGKMPRMVPPRQLERAYEKQLVSFLHSIQSQIKTKIISQLPRWSKNFEQNRPHALKNDSDPSDEILAAMEDVRMGLSREYTDIEIKRLAQKQGLTIAQYNEKILLNGFQRVFGFDIFFQQPYLASELNMFSTLNTQLITGMRDDILNKVQKDVMIGFSQGVRHEEIAKDLEGYIDPLDGTVRSRARLIARDQTNKLNGQLTELRQSELGIERYTWRTSLDERVRDSHRSKEGMEFEWANPPSDTGNPGEDIQCRCTAEPILSDLLSSASSPDDGSDE